MPRELAAEEGDISPRELTGRAKWHLGHMARRGEHMASGYLMRLEIVGLLAGSPKLSWIGAGTVRETELTESVRLEGPPLIAPCLRMQDKIEF